MVWFCRQRGEQKIYWQWIRFGSCCIVSYEVWVHVQGPHGVKYMGNKGRNKYWKIWWSGCCYFCYKQGWEEGKNQKMTKLTTSKTKMEKISHFQNPERVKVSVNSLCNCLFCNHPRPRNYEDSTSSDDNDKKSTSKSNTKIQNTKYKILSSKDILPLAK